MKSKTLLCLRLAYVAILTLLFAIGSPLLMAQSAGTSALAGTITDPSGAAIPNVTVTITNNDTGQSRTSATGSDGTYKFSLLPPGNYKVSFAATGFQDVEVGSETLNVTETPAIGPNARSRHAERAGYRGSRGGNAADASSTLGTTVTSQQVVGLPLSNRNYTQLLTMAAGANAGVNNATHDR